MLTLRAHGFAEGTGPGPLGATSLNGANRSLGALSSRGGTGFSLEGPSSLLGNTQVLSSGPSFQRRETQILNSGISQSDRGGTSSH